MINDLQFKKNPIAIIQRHIKAHKILTGAQPSILFVGQLELEYIAEYLKNTKKYKRDAEVFFWQNTILGLTVIEDLNDSKFEVM